MSKSVVLFETCYPSPTSRTSFKRGCLITTSQFEETNEFTIPGSDVVVKLRPAKNLGVFGSFAVQVVLVQPHKDIIRASFGPRQKFASCARSGNVSLTAVLDVEDVKTTLSSFKAAHFFISTDSHWKKSFLNLTPADVPDVTIHVDGKHIPTTEKILTKKSDVFRAMFEHDTKEKQTRIVKITDFSFEVVQEMVRFLMHDYCTLWDGHYDDLQAIADKYNINGMKQLAVGKKELLDEFA